MAEEVEPEHEPVLGVEAVSDLFDDKDKSDKFESALAEVAKLTDTLDGNRKTKTMVDIGNATVEVYNRNGELVEQSVAS